MKRLLALVLSLAVVLGCMSGLTLVSFAEISGNGTESDPYIIATADDFVAAFGDDSATQKNGFKRGTVYHLVADIDLKTATTAFKPNGTTIFQGKLIGVTSADDPTPMKRTIDLGTVVPEGMCETKTTDSTKNGVTTHTTNSFWYYGGIFAKASYAEFSHLILKGSVTGATTEKASTTTATDNESTSTEVWKDAIGNGATGALVGQLSGQGSHISDVDNYATVTGTAQTGGIIGYAYVNTVLTNLRNFADVTGTKEGVGGIAGCEMANIATGGTYNENLYNEGNITGTTYAGGITGKSYSTYVNCVNKGNVTATSSGFYAAGISGYACGKPINDNPITVSRNCYNSGKITGTRVGGIYGAGYGVGGRPFLVENCFNIGELDGTTVGSAVAYAQKNNVTVKGFYDLGNQRADFVGQIDSANEVTSESVYTYDSATAPATIAALTESEDAIFSSDAWVKKGDYAYPQPASLEAAGLLYDESYTPADWFVTRGSGTSSDPYKIGSLKEFELLVYSNPSAHFIQDADITGVTKEITDDFTGVYDGGGYSITYDIVSDSTQNAGLFRYNGGTITKLTTDGSISHNGTGKIYIGGIAGQNKGKIIDCINKATVKLTKGNGSSRAGGIAGDGYLAGSTITGCINYGTVEAKVGNSGGIVCVTNGSSVIENNANFGSVSGSNYTAGIICWSYCNVSNCYNFGNVACTGTGSSSFASGVAAYPAGALTVTNCFNAGSVTAAKGASYVAAVAHDNAATSAKYYNLVRCYNVKAGLPLYNTAVASPAHTPSYTNCYNVSSDAASVTVVTEEALKTTAIDGYTLFSAIEGDAKYNQYYKYPQITTNMIPADYEYGVGSSYLQENGVKGKGTEADPYIIDTPAKFRLIYGTKHTDSAELDQVMGTVDKPVYYLQTEDIDLDSNFGAQGGYYFYGIYRGGNKNGSTITYSKKLLNMNRPDAAWTASNFGLFSKVYGEISYLTITGGLKTSGNTAAGVVGTLYSGAKITNVDCSMIVNGTVNYFGGIAAKVEEGALIENCTFSGSVTGASFVGGIVSDLSGTVKNSSCSGTVTGTGTCVAGIAGQATEGALIENCTFSGTVTGGQYVGGIVAKAMGATIKNCTNNADITINGRYTAGIVGYTTVENTSSTTAFNTITGCVNNGDLTYDFTGDESTITPVKTSDPSTFQDCGGIVGCVTWATDIINTHNKGNITLDGYYDVNTSAFGATQNFGGIAGYISVNSASFAGVNVTNCSNSGDITINALVNANKGPRYEGGMAGRVWISGTNHTVAFTGCWNSGNITGANNYSAGIVGNLYRAVDSTATITDCFNTGAIEDNGSFDAAIVGYLWDKAAGYTKPMTVTNCYATEGPELYGAVHGNCTNTTVSNCFMVGDEKTGVTEVTFDEVKGLISSGKLSSSLWQTNAEYGIPELIANPFTGIIIPPLYTGSGTVDDPYIVDTLEKLEAINDGTKGGLGMYYKQTAPIEGVTFTIGSVNEAFTGGYDGNGYTIDVDLYTNEDVKSFGLFPRINGADLKGIVLTGTVKAGSSFSGSYGIGALVGYAEGTTSNKSNIDACVNKADLTCENTKVTQVAGIVGRAFSANDIITNCANYGKISGGRAAGICGVIQDGTKLENCVNYGLIEGSLYAAGIISWAYCPPSNCANFGTVRGNVAAGILANLQTSAVNNVLNNCFNAGTLDGANTYGIAHRSADIAYTVNNSYNMVYADHPIADVTDETKTKAITLNNCYYLTADTEATAAEGSTAVTSLDGMKDIKLGDAYSVAGSYAYPKVSAIEYDENEINVGFAKITLVANKGYGSFFVKDFDANEFYVQNGFDGIKLNVDPYDGYYKADVIVNTKEIASDIINDYRVVSLDAITGDTKIEIVVEKVVADGTDLGSIVETDTETYGRILTEEEEIMPGITTDKFALIAGKAPEVFGYRISEYGIIVGNSADVTMETANFKGAITDKNKMTSDYIYGALLYGQKLVEGKEYYVRAYAKYTNVNKEDFIVLGEATTFALEAAAE